LLDLEVQSIGLGLGREVAGLDSYTDSVCPKSPGRCIRSFGSERNDPK